MSWYKQRLQVTIGFVSDCFWTQVYVTTSDIDLNISLEAWPIVFLTDKIFHSIDAEMSSQRVVVVSTDEPCLNNFRYKR